MAKDGRTWECIECDAKFETGKWLGCGGDPTKQHTVESKTFYHLADSGMPSGLMVNNVTPLRQVQNAKGIFVTMPGKKAQFIGGTFVTSDPEIQLGMERRGFTMTAEQFNELQMTDKQKAARKDALLQEERSLRLKTEQKMEELKKQLAAKGKGKDDDKKSAAA